MKKVIDFIKNSVGHVNIDVKVTPFEIEMPSKNFVAIDGGSAIVVDGGSWIIGFIRIGKVEYNKKGETNEEVDEYWVGIANEQIKVFDKEGNEIRVPINYHERDMEKLVGEVRKYFEFKKAAEQDKITFVDNAVKIVEGWEDELIMKFNKVIGVPKTTRASINGRSVVGLLSKIPGRWYTKIDDQIFSKLHPKSNYVYKIDLVNLDTSILPQIAYFASDPELLGYPYPLLKVDKIARISKAEKEHLREKAKELLGDIYNDTLSQNMHKNLDDRAYR